MILSASFYLQVTKPGERPIEIILLVFSKHRAITKLYASLTCRSHSCFQSKQVQSPLINIVFVNLVYYCQGYKIFQFPKKTFKHTIKPYLHTNYASHFSNSSNRNLKRCRLLWAYNTPEQDQAKSLSASNCLSTLLSLT